MAYGYIVALFDILGFEKKLEKFGLAEMLARYEALIEVVDYRKEQIKRVFDAMEFDEAPYWASDGNIFIFNKVDGAYASDSILIWAENTWPAARDKTLIECQELSRKPSSGWEYYPVPLIISWKFVIASYVGVLKLASHCVEESLQEVRYLM